VNSILIRGAESCVVVKQIAGLIARRIVCNVRQGHAVELGQHLGLIRFGSQVDVYLPKDLEVCVGVGERVIGGISVIALSRQAVETQIRRG
jgi:phosphatidylserine decarboxylase